MKMKRFASLLAIILTVLLGSFLKAQGPAVAAAFSSSIPVAMTEQESTRPFSALGVAAKLGLGGIGFDVATPLAPKLNLRGGGYFFGYTTTLMEDNINFSTNLLLRSGQISVDWFPRNGSFRISAGVQVYNSNNVSGSGTLPGGQSFTVNHNDFISDVNDPVQVSGSVAIGRKVGPIFTVGWGNIVPRKPHSHISVPIELGFIYVGQPVVSLNFTGSACDDEGDCQSLATDPAFQQDVAAQRTRYQSNISGLRFYPIISVGLGYKF
jgi:hypothetical protein